jgi:hypothetical protein
VNINSLSPRRVSTGIKGILEKSGKISRAGRFENNI